MNLTDDQILKAKPAAYIGCQFDTKRKKMKFICWPGTRIPRIKGVIVLEQKQCDCTANAVLRATAILEKRKAKHRKMLSERDRKGGQDK